jgi:hemolysin III
MDTLIPYLVREPVSASTHFVWLLFSIPAIAFLLRLSKKNHFSLLVYGISIGLCYLGSCLYHSMFTDIMFWRSIDHIGIYYLIAGTYTPIIITYMESNCSILLTIVWSVAALGTVDCLSIQTTSSYYYIVYAWSICLYKPVRQVVFTRQMALIWLGGICYTVGAVMDVIHVPVIIPGVVQSHEVFHLLVIAGTLCHYIFVLKYVAMKNEEVDIDIYRNQTYYVRRDVRYRDSL